MLEFVVIQNLFEDDTQWSENRFIYGGGLQRKPVVVKFTRKYCPELHHYCAEQGHAPKLLGYGIISGGWHVVVMEHIDQDINHAKLAPVHWDRWNEDLTKLVQRFHEKGLVHGDLRRANLIIRKNDPGRMILIDFDWGGEVGTASFPTRFLNTELTRDNEMTSLAITKEHDDRVLRRALEELKVVTDEENETPSNSM